MKYSDRGQALAMLALLGSLLVATAIAQDDATAPAGELWETTSQMVMEGMPFKMPAQTFKLCVAPDSTAPPGANNEELQCTSTDPQRDGLKVTWTSVCTGEMPMTGRGEITYEDESMGAYSGQIRYVSEQGNVTIELSGERLDVCDNPM